jgi:hypothetical protein
MPYHLEGNCVKKADGTTVKGGCHDDHEDAVKHMDALNMAMHNEPRSTVTDPMDVALTSATDGALAGQHAQFNKDDPEVNYTDDSGGMYPCDQCRFFEKDRCDLVVGSISPQGSCDLWEPLLSQGNVNMFSMAISKASQDPITGERRYATTSSDTGFDEYNSRMTLQLFNNFVKRSAEPLPEMLMPLTSDYWKGGMPYLSVSHYLDMNGFAAIGRATDVYVQGNRFKSKGVFGNEVLPGLTDAAFNTIRSEIKNNVPASQRTRVSILFVDFQHRHLDTGYVFNRRSLTEKCEACKTRGSEPIEFLDGYLVHEALTHVPANKRTDIVVEGRSMPIESQLDDAASIVGQELAQQIEDRSKQHKPVARTALVMKSEVEEAPLGGATTIADALTWAQANDQAAVLADPWELLQVVSSNIARSTIEDKQAAIASAFGEANKSLHARALHALSKLDTQGVPLMPTETTAPAAAPTTPAPIAPAPVTPAPAPIPAPVAAHPLDPVFAEMRAAYDRAIGDVTLTTRAQKYEVVQAPINTLGAVIKRAVDASAPQDISEQIAAGVAQALQQLGFAPQQIGRSLVPQQAPTNGDPTPRQFQPPSLVTTAPAQPAPTTPAAQPEQRSVLQAPALGQQVPGATAQLFNQANGNGGQPQSKLSQMVRRSVIGAQRAGG